MVAPSDLRHAEVNINDILAAGGRLDASVFSSEAKAAKERIEKSPFPKLPLAGPKGLVQASHRPRFKRAYVDRPGVAFYQPAQILELMPSPARYISEANRESYLPLKVHRGQILLTCSGTIGDVALVGDQFDGVVFSHDLIRLDIKDTAFLGYIYAFLKSDIGRLLITTSNYGAVIQHIEPKHLEEISIPVVDQKTLSKINSMILRSRKLQDEAIHLTQKSNELLIAKLNLNDLNISDFENSLTDNKVKGFSINSLDLNERFEAGYHNPVSNFIERRLDSAALEMKTLGDSQLLTEIRLPTQFKRVYVEKGHGIPFFSGRSIGELNPSGKRYLAFSQHEKKIKELIIRESMVLVTCSGTVGNVVYVPEFWDGWAMTHDIIRIIPKKPYIGGYISTWLNSEMGQRLIKKHVYGAVVQHIDANHMADVPIPILAESDMEEVGRLILQASDKLTEANELERDAIETFEQSIPTLDSENDQSKNIELA